MTFERAADPRTLAPGQYAPIHWRFPVPAPVHLHAVACCPSCGRRMSIASRVHSVSEDGTLAPSLVCPYACDFHVFARLDGWVPGESAYV